MLISLQNESLPLPFTWVFISTTLRVVSLRKWFRGHARVAEGERRKKRDFLVANGRELDIRKKERDREAVFAQVTEKCLEICYLSGK